MAGYVRSEILGEMALGLPPGKGDRWIPVTYTHAGNVFNEVDKHWLTGKSSFYIKDLISSLTDATSLTRQRLEESRPQENQRLSSFAHLYIF